MHKVNVPGTYPSSVKKGIIMLIPNKMHLTPHSAALKTLPYALRSLIRAAREGNLKFPANFVDATTQDLGHWVLECAARYATGHYRQRRLRDLWEAYGAWQIHREQR